MLQACHILGIKDKEFRDGNFEFLQEAFGRKMESYVLASSQTKRSIADFTEVGFRIEIETQISKLLFIIKLAKLIISLLNYFGFNFEWKST